VTPWEYNSPRKRLLIASFEEPQGGIINNRFEVDVTNIQKFIEETREKSGVRVTVTHVVVKAIGEMLKAAPDINGKIILGKYVPFKHANVSLTCDVEGKDVNLICIEDVDKLTIEDIAEEINKKSKASKSKTDTGYVNRSKSLKYAPSFIINLMLYFGLIVGQWMGKSINRWSLAAHPLGGAMVTNVGIFGLKDGTAAVPTGGIGNCIIAVNKITDRAVVKDGKIEIVPTMIINVSIDHRFLDGSRAKVLSDILDLYLQNPWKGSRLDQLDNKVKATIVN